MRALTYWTWTRVMLVLMISPFLTTAQIRSDCRADLTQAQIREGIKRFDYIVSLSDPKYEAEGVKRVEDCLRNCNQKQRSLFIKEVLLRLQTRGIGEDCTSSDEKYTYALYTGDYRSGTEVYQAWQNEILDTGLTFCDPFKHLYCSPISKKCECRPGTGTRLGDIDKKESCLTKLGGNCWLPGVVTPDLFHYPLLFDPYSDTITSGIDYIEIGGSFCSVNGVFGNDVRYRCISGLKLFLNNMCADTEIRDLDRDLQFSLDFASMPLNFGDSCNLEHQTQLFTTTEEEIRNYAIRVQRLKAMRASKAQFCDNNRLLVCGSAGKCECMKPAIYNNETIFCTFRSPHESCQEEFKFKQIAFAFPGKVSQELLNGFEITRKRECPIGCYRPTFMGGIVIDPIHLNIRFCFTCSNPSSARAFIFGKNCDKILAGFLAGVPPPSLPIDIPEYDKQLELFVQFSEKAKEFQGLFVLDANSTCECDYEAELDVARLSRRIKNVEVPGIILTEQDYKDLMSSMDKHIIGKKLLCRLDLFSRTEPPDNRPAQLCSPTTPNAISVCHITNNTVYLEELVKRLSGKSFQATPVTPTCSPHPRDVIQYAEEIFPISRPPNANANFVTTGLSTDAYEYLFNTLENLFIQNVQFCNRTGGFKCTKSVDDKTNVNGTGKCEFSQDVLDEVEAEIERMEADRTDRMSGVNTTSKSSHKFIQHLLPTLLFILPIINLN